MSTASVTQTGGAATVAVTISRGLQGPTGPTGPPPPIDLTIIDGSTNAVSGNAVFDGLALKAPIANPIFTGIVTAPRITGRCDGLEVLCKAGLAINAGQVVYATGASGNNIIIGLAQANAELTSSKTIGISESTLAHNATGYVITEGLMTVSISAPTANEGDPIWLSPSTAGGMVFGVANKPVSPNHMVYLGVVTRKTGNTVVEIYVKIQNGSELDELADVLITSPAEGQALMRGATAWENRNLASSDILGVTSQRLIGRHAGTSGAGQEVSIGTGIEFSGSTIQRSALTGDITASAGSNATTLAGTIAGNKTLSGQLELTGQAATNLTSAMTRGLVGDYAHFSRDLFRDIVLNASGTGATVRRNFAGVGVLDGDISTSGVNGTYIRASIITGSLDNYFDGNSAVSFSRRWTLFTKVALNIQTNTQFYLGVGVNATTGIPSSGTNIGFQFTANNSVRLWRCNGGAATFSDAGAVFNLPVTYPFTGFHYIWLECVGNGTINLYINYAAFGSGPVIKPSTALCTLTGVGASSSANAISSFLYATGTPGGFTSQAIGDCRFIEY